MTSLHTDLDLTDAVEAAARHHWEHRNPALAPWDDVVTANPGLAHAIREQFLPAVTAAAPVIAAAAIARARVDLDLTETVEDVARLLYERFSQNRVATWDDLGDVADGPGSTREWYRDRAREVLELYPARQHGGA